MKTFVAAVMVSLLCCGGGASAQVGAPLRYLGGEIVPFPQIVSHVPDRIVRESELDGAQMIGAYPIVDDIPYYRYWQLDEAGTYAFHPAALAAAFALLSASDRDLLEKVFDATSPLATPLANGGVTWFYPKIYPLNRMVTPNRQYSVISQARLVAASLKMAAADPDRYGKFAEKIAKGMVLDYHDGGIFWENILLEFPLYHSPPEVILNGWLDGLLNFGDVPGAEHEAAYIRSAEKMASMLPMFDDPEHRLSLYSDTSPIRSFIRRSQEGQQFSVEFVAKGDFPSYEIDIAGLAPVVINGKELRSPYETQAYSDNGTVVTTALSCNQKYDTYVVSSAPFTVQLSVGYYDPERATPSSTGETITLESRGNGRRHTVHINSARNKMFCGYPTNFAKDGGENFYHPYHIVALLILSLDDRLSAHAREEMLKYARRWMSYSSELEAKGMKFSGYQRILDTINMYKFRVIEKDWHNLVARALQ